jgi:hypothetical protein
VVSAPVPIFWKSATSRDGASRIRSVGVPRFVHAVLAGVPRVFARICEDGQRTASAPTPRPKSTGRRPVPCGSLAMPFSSGTAPIACSRSLFRRRASAADSCQSRFASPVTYGPEKPIWTPPGARTRAMVTPSIIRVGAITSCAPSRNAFSKASRVSSTCTYGVLLGSSGGLIGRIPPPPWSE